MPPENGAICCQKPSIRLVQQISGTLPDGEAQSWVCGVGPGLYHQEWRYDLTRRGPVPIK